MKRLYLTVVALLSMTMTFAGNENRMGNMDANAPAETTMETNADSIASYDISYNLRRLGETLGLTLDQMSSVEALNRTFRSDLMNAANANEADRKAMLDGAVAKDIRCMGYVLTPEQLGKYKTLINTTLANRGIER